MLAAFALLLAANAGSACSLDLLDPAGAARLARVPLPHEREFALHYTHSVSLHPVESHYVVRDGSIVQVAEVFDEHGPGMSTEPAPGERLELQHDGGDRFVLHMSRPIDRLVIRLHERPAFRLVIRGQTIALDQWHTRSIELRPDCPNDGRAR